MKIHEKIGSVEITLDTSRIDGNLREAQKLLNLQIAADCDPVVPFEEGGGALRGSVRYPKGIYGGELMYDDQKAHYQYMGIVYGPNIPKKDTAGNITGWWSPPHKHPTERKLKYHTPGTSDHWFEVTKARVKKEWIKLVEKTAGKK